ncbi:MAG: secondary thiamine-phosphate synthase enzyme YjbQ [Clostridiales Family XIII bacterium]|nr:secondary thiamine-phosphate synthase enzyme YjbQ [Clostridiales Family XIII bacterium]
MLKQFEVNTAREGLTDITASVRKAVAESGVTDGLVVVHCPHTTAGITINENADPDVVHDFLIGMDEAFPDRQEFRHGEGNSHAHLKSSSVGPSLTLIIADGRPLLGTWQGIYFCEFDGPRRRKYFVKVISD